MCIIIAKTADSLPPSDRVLQECWASNPHGAGIAYVNDTGGVSISKGHMTLEALTEALSVVREVKGAQYLVHFRIATHGGQDESNTHPFWTDKGKVAICHNGILPISRLADPVFGRSDTHMFAEDVLSKLPPDWHKDAVWTHVIEEYMGPGNKIATITAEGVSILNRDRWNEDTGTGLLFSNSSWRPRVHPAEEPSRYSRGQALTSQPLQVTEDDLLGCFGDIDRLNRLELLDVSDAAQLTALLEDGQTTPKSVEILLDCISDSGDPASIPGLMTLTESANLSELLIKLQEAYDSAEEETKETAKPPAIPKTVAAEPLYSAENCKCFLDKYVKLVWDDNGIQHVRHCRIIGADDQFIEYAKIDGSGQGQLAWHMITLIAAVLEVNRPTEKALSSWWGATIHAIPKTSPQISGMVTGIYADRLTIITGESRCIDLEYRDLVSVLILENRRVLSAKA